MIEIDIVREKLLFCLLPIIMFMSIFGFVPVVFWDINRHLG